MASYLSTQVAKQVGAIGLSPGPIVETFSVTIASGTVISTNDTITLAQIPLFATVLDIYLSLSGSLGTSVTFELGDTTTVGKYIASGSTGFTAAIDNFIHVTPVNAFVAASLPSATYTTQTTASIPAGLTLNPSSNVADYLLLTCTGTGGALGANRTLKGYMLYTLNKAS